jgi:hypothetical protein
MSAAWKTLVALSLLIVARSPAADPPVALPLTQFEVLGLVQQGIGDAAVIAKLRESGSTFRLSTSDKQMLKALGVSDRVLTAMTSDSSPPGSIVPAAATAPRSTTSRPVGKWVRESGPMRIALHFTEDRLTLDATIPAMDDSDTTITLTADADYSVNSEGLLYGVITAIDADYPMAAAEVQLVAGHTFSVRCRVDGTTLTVRDLKLLGSGLPFHGRDDDISQMALFAGGRYQKDDGSKPAPARKPAKLSMSPFGQRQVPSRCDAAGLPLDAVVIPPPPTAPVPQMVQRQIIGFAPDGRPVERIGIDFDTPLPPPPSAPPPMIVQAAVAPTPVSPSPATPAPASSKLDGIWVREFDGMQVVLKLTDKRLYATLNIAYVEEGKSGELRMTFRADADYAVGPDGTLFGVVTGTDFTPSKDECAETAGALKMMAGLNGMPFCFRFRIDEGVLSIRDLRCGVVDEDGSTAVLGRYTRTEKEPAPPKAVKMPRGCDSARCQPPSLVVPNVQMNPLPDQSFESGPPGETAPAPRPVPPERLHGGIVG